MQYDVEDVDDGDDEVEDEDEEVEEWGGRWQECDAYTPRTKKNNKNYLINVLKNVLYLLLLLDIYITYLIAS